MEDRENMGNTPDPSGEGLAEKNFSRRQVLGGLAAGAFTVAFSTLDLGRYNLAFAQTNTQVNSSSLNTGQTMYKTLWLSTYKGNERTKQLASNVILQSLYRENPDLPPEQAVEMVREFQNVYDQEITRGENLIYQQSKSETDKYLFAIEVVGKAMKAGGEFGDAGGELLELLYKNFVFDPIKEQWSEVNQYTSIQAQYNSFQAVSDFEGEILTRMVKAQNPGYQTALDMLQAANLNTSVKDPDAAKIIASHPELQVPTLLQDLIKNGQSLNISMEQLRDLMGKEFDKLEGMYADQMELLKNLDAQEKQLLAYAKAEEERRKQEALAQRKAQEYQLVLEGANSTIYLLSQLIGIADKKAANDFAVIGKAAIQVGDSIKKFAESVASFGSKQLSGLALGMSGAIMTGNIVAAVMNVVSIFLPQGPTLEEQVAQLREEMNDRFDRVETRLNEIYNAIQDGFDRLHGNVQAVLQDLSHLELEVSTLGRDLQESMQTAGRRPLFEVINGAIGYEKRTGQKMPYGKYTDYENTFHAWATIHAKDELEEDTNNRSYEDIDLLDELSRPLEDNIMYLATFLTKRWNVPSFTNARLAHPTVWAMSSRGYAELRREWPDYARRVSAKRNDEVQEVGKQLHDALRQITVKADTSGNTVPNYELFDKLHANYMDKAGDLLTVLQNHENSYLQRQPWYEAEPHHVDFWGGPTQRINYVPKLPENSTPEGVRPPDSLVSSFIPATYILAEYLGFNKLRATYSSGWNDLHAVNLGLNWIGQPTASVTVNYGDQPILTRFVVGPPVKISAVFLPTVYL